MNGQHQCDPCEREESPVYRIGLFAQMNHVTVKALRYYDDIGLLRPACIDKTSGYRYYTSQQLPALHQILALRQMGFTIEEIKKVRDGMPEQELLQRKKSELMKGIAEATLKLSQVESYLLQKDAYKDYRVLLKELPEVIVASMKMNLPNYEALFSVVPPMGAEMERLGCTCAVPDYCFTEYLEGYREENINVEICQAVTEKKQDSDMVTFKTIEKVETAACVLHKGPYTGFPKAYAAILNWIEENGYEITGNPRESYIDGVWNKDSEEDWLSEIQFPVGKKEHGGQPG